MVKLVSDKLVRIYMFSCANTEYIKNYKTDRGSERGGFRKFTLGEYENLLTNTRKEKVLLGTGKSR